jgi:hypothetical protein
MGVNASIALPFDEVKGNLMVTKDTMNQGIESQNDAKNPLSDLMFDWVSVLHSKAEGVAAYDKYLRDAREKDADKCINLFTKLRNQDIAAVREIKDHLAMMLSKDTSRGEEIRASRPSQASSEQSAQPSMQ